MKRDTAGRAASGAQIYVADLVWIAMVREMGAMMAGNIMVDPRPVCPHKVRRGVERQCSNLT